MQTDFIDGRPVIYYVKSEAAKNDGQYLAYRISNGVEEALVVESVGNPTFVYSPIINVEKFPPSLAKSARVDKKNSGYVVIKLSDLSSLAKVAAYKTMYDEPPLPLFLFKKPAGPVIVGATMNMNDNDTIPYFYYIAIGNEEPKEPFIRFSSLRVEQPVFSSRLDDHGYVYLKLIKLASDHPLVKTYD